MGIILTFLFCLAGANGWDEWMGRMDGTNGWDEWMGRMDGVRNGWGQD